MNLFAIAGLGLGISSSLLSFIVLFLSRNKLHHIWFFFNLAVAVWGYGCFLVGIASNEASALLYWKIAHIGGLFVSVFFYHMVCLFSGLNRYKSIFVAYVLGFLFLGLNLGTRHFINKSRFIYNLYYNDATWPYTVALTLWLFWVIWGFVDLIKFYPKTNGIKRTQTIYIILGFLVGFIGGISTFLPEFSIDFLYPFGNLTIPIYCAISTYAIFRYRLLDIYLAIKQSMAYSLAAGLLMGIFAIIVINMTNFFASYAHISSLKFNIVAALVIALFFNPLRVKIQKMIDTLFYKKTYDYYATVTKVSRELNTLFNFKEICTFVGDIIYSTLGLKNIYVLSAVPHADYEVFYHAPEDKNQQPGQHEPVMKLSRTSRLVETAKKLRDIIIREELPALEADLGQASLEKLESEFRSFQGDAALPVFVDDRLSLMAIMGSKTSGDMLSDEDLGLLKTIANQTGIALKTAGLYREKIAAEKLASVGMMSATFAHEIRNPMTSLKTFVQLMPEKYYDEEFRETFGKIVPGEIAKIDNLIRDLLDFASDKKSIRVSEFNLINIIEETMEYVKNKMAAGTNNILFNKKYNIMKEIPMSGDDGQLKQVFINIMTNGCQAMKGEGILTVDLNPNGRNVEISITDTGEGIPHEEISKIFDPFVTTKEMGVGLGLAICKKIVENHGGRIHVMSEVSKGSTFTIVLPLRQ